jgi:2-polyprenyl-6-methoxyphenol hydroxylase-like FAD-dependent oxidoreductase
VTRILIVGAGIAGLALARELLESAAEVHVIERSRTFRESGAGIIVHPNGMHLLNHLGIAVRVQSAGSEIKVIDISRPEGSLVIPLDEVWRGACFPTVCIPRGELHRIMNDVDWAAGCIQFRNGLALTAVADTGQALSVLFDTGESASYDLVIGADGVNSATRRALFPTAYARATGVSYMRFLATNISSHCRDTWKIIERPEGTFGFVSSGNLVHCFLQVTDDTLPSGNNTIVEEYLVDVVSRWAPELGTMARTRLGELHAGPAFAVHPPSWGLGRCVLVGDASHAVSPSLSEGGALALEDAIALAGIIKTCDGDARVILDRYRAARANVIAWACRVAQSQVNSFKRLRGSPNNNVDGRVALMAALYCPFLESAVRVCSRASACKVATMRMRPNLP